MTDCPPWVQAALNLEKKGVYLHSDEDIHLVHNVRDVVTLVSTSINKLGNWDTYKKAPTCCWKCPQPLYPYEGRDYDVTIEQRFCVNQKKMIEKEIMTFRDNYKIFYTERCTSCGNRRRSLDRARGHVDRLEMVAAVKNRRISFVTLTFPNYIGEDVRKGYAILKKKVKAFRRKYKNKGIVIDGYDYFEHTTHPDFLGWSNPYEFNVHQHGLWVMKYWDIYDFNKEWGHIAHLTELKSKDSRRKALGYAQKYCLKDSDNNGRNAQSFGSCYGSAYAEIKFQAKHLSELLDAEDVNE